MYFQYKDHAFTCNCDWLQYSVRLKDPDRELVCPEGFRVELTQGNNIFSRRALVFDLDGRKVLTLLWKPYSSVIQGDIMTCQVANELLYTHGIQAADTLLHEIAECDFNAVGRIDVCLDFEADEAQLQFLRHLNSHHYYAERKSEGSVWWHTTTENGFNKKQLHCLSWGSPTSEIKVKIYHKSREQGLVGGETPEKPWIVDEWKEIGMDVTKVWRIEFSMQGAGQLRYNGQPITLDNVTDNEWLLGVFLDMYHHRFVTRINSGKRSGHHNNDRRVYLVNLPARTTHLTWAEPRGDDHEVSAAITLLRSMMRQIDNPVVLCDKTLFRYYTTTLRDLIHRGRLEGYFAAMTNVSAAEYFTDLETKIGGGVVEHIASPALLFD